MQNPNRAPIACAVLPALLIAPPQAEPEAGYGPGFSRQPDQGSVQLFFLRRERQCFRLRRGNGKLLSSRGRLEAE